MSTRNVISAGILALALCLNCDAAAQSNAALERRANLEKLSGELRQKAEQEKRHAHDVARRMGIPFRRELGDGRVIELQRIAPTGTPIYYITDNLAAADTTSTDEVWPGGSAGLSLDGSGLTLGIWDEGSVLSSHDEFTNGGGSPSRVTQMDVPAGISDHSTHVAGTMIASGFDVDAKGMASAAYLEAYDWNFDATEMAAAAAIGIPTSNHSYGVASGWLNLLDPACNNWWWLGGELAIEDYKFGHYDSEAQSWDEIAFDASFYLIVKSAGNDRSASNTGPGLNGGHCWLSADETTLTYSTMSRNSDCYNGVHPPGYDCLPTISVAKNILTVGAAQDIPGGYTPFPGPTSVVMTDFSGWGPTDDGRIKPDLVANGYQVYSSVQTWCIFVVFCTDYNIFDGTSMAAPNTTGSVLLLQEHYQATNGPSMQASTAKALVIQTADEAGSAAGPDYKFGYGMLNTKTAAQVITEDGASHRIIEGTLANGGSDTVQINVNEPEANIKATLVWTDPPGAPVGTGVDEGVCTAPADSGCMLVNDLDLRITSSLPSSPHLPWVLDPANPAATATRGDNFRDNVEQVVIEDVGPGAYFVEISHKGTLQDTDDPLDSIPNDQNYSLIISVIRQSPASTVDFLFEEFESGLPTGWSVIPSPNSGPIWDIYDDNDNLAEFNNQTGGSDKYAMAHYGLLLAPFNTELRTAVLDLSSHDEVTLEFKSHFEHFFFERISVDVSTNGGTIWTEKWMHEHAPLPGPSTQVVDLTNPAANQSNVIIRFQFESINELDGLLWQVDDVRVQVPGGGNTDDPCGGTYSMPADQWRFLALPCDPDSPATVASIFGDNLNPANYGSRWIIYSRDHVNDQYVFVPNVNQTLNQAEGLMILSLDPTLLDVAGSATTLGTPSYCSDPHFPDSECYEILLAKHTDGASELSNALGHPLAFPVDWADFRIRIAGDPILRTPSDAETMNLVEKVVHKYSGSAYVPYDDVTPGYSHGALGAFDAFWLKTMVGSHAVGNLSLLVPKKRSTGIITAGTSSPVSSMLSTQTHGGEKIPPSQAKRDEHVKSHREKRDKGDEWYVRLRVEATPEELMDEANVLGQLADSVAGFDDHDLREPAPFTPYLTIVFPHADWGEHADDYTSDFHAPTKKHVLDEWSFEVRSNDPNREVTLSWTSAEDVFKHSLLIDIDSGEIIEPDAQDSYTFVMGAQVRHFAWEYEKKPGKKKKK